MSLRQTRFLPPTKSNATQKQNQRREELQQPTKTDKKCNEKFTENENLSTKERTDDHNPSSTNRLDNVKSAAPADDKKGHCIGNEKVKDAKLCNPAFEACSSWFGRCRLRRTGSFREDRSRSVCLDKSLGEGNAFSTKNHGEGFEARRAKNNEYEFCPSPSSENARKPEVTPTAAEAEVERVILKGHQEFMMLLERRNKLREKMAASSICYQEPYGEIHLGCNEYEDVEAIPWFGQFNDNGGYFSWTENVKHCQRQVVLTSNHAIHTGSSGSTCYLPLMVDPGAGCDDRMRPIDRDIIMLDQETDITSGVNGVNEYDDDVTQGLKAREENDNGVNTPAHVPTFLSLISQLEEE